MVRSLIIISWLLNLMTTKNLDFLSSMCVAPSKNQQYFLHKCLNYLASGKDLCFQHLWDYPHRFYPWSNKCYGEQQIPHSFHCRCTIPYSCNCVDQLVPGNECHYSHYSHGALVSGIHTGLQTKCEYWHM